MAFDTEKSSPLGTAPISFLCALIIFYCFFFLSYFQKFMFWHFMNINLQYLSFSLSSAEFVKRALMTLSRAALPLLVERSWNYLERSWNYNTDRLSSSQISHGLFYTAPHHSVLWFHVGRPCVHPSSRLSHVSSSLCHTSVHASVVCRTNFHGPKDVRAIGDRLYLLSWVIGRIL